MTNLKSRSLFFSVSPITIYTEISGILLMKITIDTTNDSKDDIRKVIRFLYHIVGDSDGGNLDMPEQKNIFDSSSPGIGSQEEGVLGSFFGDSSALADNSSNASSDVSEENEDIELVPY
jgi:hypothetical protein